MIPGIRDKLFTQGLARLSVFCAANALEVPTIRPTDRGNWPFQQTCAYYRPTYIAICLDRCAQPGYAARAWSWPGYVIDRTPFGVLQHELGHHADIVMSGMESGYQGEYSRKLRRDSGEPKLTNYCPNDAEWFAEIFRLFVTNADLLRLLRPKTYGLIAREFEPVSAKSWRTELASAPERTIAMAEKKIGAV